jgi:putative NIF3 family GTP cyclohydrolase 1 type 2
LRLTGQPGRSVHKVAVCSGSGAGLVSTAAHQGADVLVTGDIKYHDARQAEDLGIALIDAGHFPTEQLMVDRLTEILTRTTNQRGWDITYQAYTGEVDPFRFH